MATFLRRDEWVTDATGNAISGAQVYVCSQPANTGTLPPSPLAQLYSDPAGANPIIQPVVTDGFGHAFYYTTPGTYTVVYYSPQIGQNVLPDQLVGGGDSIPLPVSIPDGGTGATTAPTALVNLGAAANGANVDITSLGAIGTPGGASTTSTFNSSGWKFGAGTFGTGGNAFVQVANQAWTGSGFTGLAVGVQDASSDFALLTTSGFFTNGEVSANFIRCIGTLAAQSIIQCDNIESFTPGTRLSLAGQGITGAGSVGIELEGNGTLGECLVSFGNNTVTYPTQTTVGSAGSASAPPATPLVWLPVKVDVAGVMTEVVLACYKPS